MTERQVALRRPILANFASQYRVLRNSLLIGIAFVVQASAETLADENPFGLPAPRKPNQLGSVMLHGGGQSLRNEVRHEFVRLAGGREARILLMPSEMCQFGTDDDGKPLPQKETIADYERRLASPASYGRWVWLREERQVDDFQFLYRDRQNDPDDLRFFSLLELKKIGRAHV